jgi:hypothetical protein
VRTRTEGRNLSSVVAVAAVVLPRPGRRSPHKFEVGAPHHDGLHVRVLQKLKHGERHGRGLLVLQFARRRDRRPQQLVRNRSCSGSAGQGGLLRDSSGSTSGEGSWSACRDGQALLMAMFPVTGVCHLA